MKSVLSYDLIGFVSPRLLQLTTSRNHRAENSKLQKAQHCAAGLILGKPRSMLTTLHLLPVNARIEYKVSVLCYNTLHSSMPSYLKDLFNSNIPERAFRSQDSKLLIVPKSNLKTIGARAFTVTGPIIWNSLPPPPPFP